MIPVETKARLDHIKRAIDVCIEKNRSAHNSNDEDDIADTLTGMLVDVFEEYPSKSTMFEAFLYSLVAELKTKDGSSREMLLNQIGSSIERILKTADEDKFFEITE